MKVATQRDSSFLKDLSLVGKLADAMKLSSVEVTRPNFLYRSLTKLREGNVFSPVCLSVYKRSITHDALDLTIQGPPLPVHGPSSGASVQELPWPPPDMEMFKYVEPGPHRTWTQNPWLPQTCSNLFIMKHVRLASGCLVSYCNAFLPRYFSTNDILKSFN